MFTTTKLSDEQARRLLEVRRLPGRLTVAESSVLLGFGEHDICTLVTAKLICPLGDPASNAPKYFFKKDVEDRANDRQWLTKATKTISNHWKQKNLRKTTKKP